ncbi:MAG: hypothetical protein E7L17_13760 [Clostridium sp.]|uniref:hypothetical protein n=1 Tax=Clostridium sp. TaxID=1506 RepID=UPI0029090D55|nr:hypothetical protein [Clostridium sp.]MDU7339166.1 hypothetical protein [Clostridium sp.]
MKKRMKAIAIALIGAISLSMSVAATTYEQANKAFKLDTRSYTMAPGNIYDFKVILKGGLTQKDVKVSDSRTGSIVKMTAIKNTDKYRITAVKEGTTFITAEVGGAHLSFKVDVKKGVKQGGQATYSNYAIVPDSYQPVNSGSTTNNGVKPMYPNYTKPYNTEAIIADMVAEGKRLGMMHNPDFKITKIVNLESGGVEVSGGAGYRMPDSTVHYTVNELGYDNSYWMHKNCMENVQDVMNVGIELAGAKPEDIRFNPVMLSEGNGDYLIYVFYG